MTNPKTKRFAAKPQPDRATNLRELFRKIAEVQMAGVKAGVKAWCDYAHVASDVNAAIQGGLIEITKDPSQTRGVLSGLGRAYVEALAKTFTIGSDVCEKLAQEVKRHQKQHEE